MSGHGLYWCYAARYANQSHQESESGMAKREIIIHASGDGNEWTASIYIDGKKFSGIAALPRMATGAASSELGRVLIKRCQLSHCGLSA
jgi:hypothetical protein